MITREAAAAGVLAVLAVAGCTTTKTVVVGPGATAISVSDA